MEGKILAIFLGEIGMTAGNSSPFDSAQDDINGIKLQKNYKIR
jgi:hypothetical protein